jgi:transcription elongation factor GreA
MKEANFISSANTFPLPITKYELSGGLMNRIPITPEGKVKLEKELEHLTKVHLPKNIRDIEEARSHGDISENAEFHAAKETQALLQAQIGDLRMKLSNCEIIDPASTPKDRVVFGAKVQVEDLNSGTQKWYQVLGPYDADPNNGSISYTAPLGKALLGKEEGDSVIFKAPGGIQELEILKIE